MKTVLFYAPHCGVNMLRYVRPVLELPDVHLIGITQDSNEYLDQIGCPFNEYIRVDDADDPAQIEAAVQKILSIRKVDRLLNILEQQQEMISAIREKYGIAGIHSEVARRFRDKAYMKQILKENGILCANFKRVESWQDVQSFINEYGYPFVIKPLGGAGAINTFAVYSPNQLEPYLQQMQLSPTHPAIMEEYIEGEEGSFETLTLNGEVKFYSMTTYFPGPMAAMLNPWIQIIFNFNKDIVDSPEYADVREVGHQVIKAMGLGTSITHMEWFRRKKDGQIYIGEIAARPPGEPIPGLHNYGHDISLPAAWGKLMALGEYDLQPERKHHVSCARLRAQGSGTAIREIHGLETVRQAVGHLIMDAQIAPIGTPKTTSYMGESYVFCRGQNYDEVFQAARFITETVRIFC